MNNNVIYDTVGKTYDTNRKPDPEIVEQLLQSFHLSINKTELDNGLKNLAADIESGQVKNTIEEYESDLGDYLFISGEK